MHGCKLVALVVVAALAGAAAPAGASTLGWSDPAPIDNIKPPGSLYMVTGASCPTTGLCVVTDFAGNIYVSTDPFGGPGAWSVSAVTPGVSLMDVSCPAVSLCVASDVDGDIVTSTDPAAAAWTVSAVDPGNWIQRVACPTTSLCVASDTAGNVLTTSDPAGGPGAWTVTAIGITLWGLSCPAATLCVGAGSANTVVTTTDPAGGAGAWSAASVAGVSNPGDVSCPAVSFCALTDSTGHVATATNPTGGAAAWTISDFGDNAPHSIACASSTLCLTGDSTPYLRLSTNPGAVTPTWTSTQVTASGSVDPFCFSASLCIGATSEPDGAIVLSADPAGGVAAWSETSLASVGHFALSAAACLPTDVCLVGDDGGAMLSSPDPEAGLDAWGATDLSSLGIDSVLAMSCPGPSMCVATDSGGHAAWSDDPAGDATAWHAAAVDPGHELRGVSCPSPALCAAVDDAGRALTTSAAAGGAWSAAAVEPGVAINGISCPASDLCVAADERGNVLVSTDPTGGAGTWAIRNVSAAALTGISCPSESFCLAVGAQGAILSSLAPARPVMWRTSERTFGAMTGANCPSESLCLATAADGRVAASTFPASTSAADWHDDFDAGHVLTSVACSADGLCVVGDELGFVTGGDTGGLPINREPPAVAGVPAVGNALTCSPGTWTGGAPLTYSYRWARNGTAISGATGSTYTVQAIDTRADLGCLVTASGGGRTATASSALASVITKPTVVAAPHIAGSAVVGSTLTCVPSFAGSTPMTLVFSWSRDDRTIVPAGPSSAYTTRLADAGHRISCTATASNPAGSASAWSPPVTIASAPLPPFSARITARAVRRAALLRHGLPVSIRCSRPCIVGVRVALLRARHAPVRIARRDAVLLLAGERTVHVRIGKRARRQLRGLRRIRLRITATEAEGRRVSGASVLVLH